MGKIADEGANDAALVNALVLVEALVLGGEEGLLHRLRNIGERHPHAALVLLEDLGKALAAPVEHNARARKLEAFELVVIGQICERLVVEIDHVTEIDRGRIDLLVLAELAVGDLQVCEIYAMKDLALAGNSLRIFHRGCDQLVEIDVLDIEGLAHMAAACAQELANPRLIGGAVEPGHDRVRRRGHLAERQRSREHLDQQGFHRPSREPE